MPSINIPALAHVAPTAMAGWQWLPFTDATYLRSLQAAIAIINTQIKGVASCDAAFRALPGGRTTAQVWADPAVWISYDPDNSALRFAATQGNEITLSQYTCKMGSWTIVATLIHELAHVNGASSITHDAENTLQHCIMRKHHNPAILGQGRC
jgi:uncharacterized cupin superfamily protein